MFSGLLTWHIAAYCWVPGLYVRQPNGYECRLSLLGTAHISFAYDSSVAWHSFAIFWSVIEPMALCVIALVHNVQTFGLYLADALVLALIDFCDCLAHEFIPYVVRQIAACIQTARRK